MFLNRSESHGRRAAVPLVNSSVYRVLAWIGVGLQAVALVAVVLLERWSGMSAISIFLVLSIAFLAAQDRVPNLIDLLIVIAAMIHATGWA